MRFSYRRRVYASFLFLSLFLSGCNLTVEVVGQGVVQSLSGSIDCGTQCKVLVPESEQLDILVATPAEGYKFIGWGGECSGTGTCEVTTGSTTGHNKVIANFEALTAIPLRPVSHPSEYVGATVEVVLSGVQDFVDIAEPLLGDTAKNGGHLTPTEIEPGIRISSSPSTSNPDQLVVTAEMTVSGDVQPATRTMMAVPVSYGSGKLFIDAVKVAMTKMATIEVERPEDVEPFHIEYRSNSVKGGKFRIGVVYDTHETTLVYRIESPTTSLLVDQINQPALEGQPYETIYGMVNFTLSRDQFTFFASRAYGFSAGKDQNFQDFLLLPHDWLRLNIEPQLSDRIINVGFELVNLDGDRIAIAKAPASAVAGEQFMQTVLRRVDNMRDKEEVETGSSRDWEVPFYYADADGGGVVEVLAQGRSGQFQISYRVESPTNYLDEVDFIPYQGTVDIPADWNEPEPDCESLSLEQTEGKFELKFFASSTVTNSYNLDGPLMGNIWGSIYRAQDVTLLGPNPGSVSMADFEYTNVDISTPEGSPLTYLIDTPLPAGKYQILGFMDIDGNADVGAPLPDKNDPVMIPIGGYDMTCVLQTKNVEFAILNP